MKRQSVMEDTSNVEVIIQWALKWLTYVSLNLSNKLLGDKKSTRKHNSMSSDGFNLRNSSGRWKEDNFQLS